MVRWQRDAYEIDDTPERLDVDLIHGFLRTSYWAEGVPRHVVARCIARSIVLGLYHGDAQVGFARVVTDGARFAWLADVFVLDGHQGRGLARWMVQCALDHPETAGVSRFLLATRDAHGVYEPLGFAVPEQPERLMERRQPPPWKG